MASIEMNAAQPKAHSGIFAKIASVFVSLTENLVMIAMGLFTLTRLFVI